MDVLRTPDERFADLADYPFEGYYVDVDDGGGDKVRMHFLDEGPLDGELVLLLHGQPTWSYLYRKMIPMLSGSGCRVMAPDFIGFGRSDKPTDRGAYSYTRHVRWLQSLILGMEMHHITLVCQDWGGLIGLRAAAEMPDRFARIVTANTALPDAQGVDDEAAKTISDRMRQHYEALPVYSNAAEMFTAMAADDSGMGFLNWVKFCSETPELKASEVVSFACDGLGEEVKKGYDAPFPDDSYMAGARQFPSLVPIMPDDPEIGRNRDAWKTFESWTKPFLTAFSDGDPVTEGQHERFQNTVPGAKDQPHATIWGAGHFLQEQHPGPLAATVLRFMAVNPL